jgi:hypothetical protein
MSIDPVLLRLAASAGDDVKRIKARTAVVTAFFEKNLYALTGDWDVVRRAMQCIDLRQPVVEGPSPPVPPRLFELAVDTHLGHGFFVERPPAAGRVLAGWQIAAEASYLRWSSPYSPEARKSHGGAPGEARFFVPAARQGLTHFARRI